MVQEIIARLDRSVFKNRGLFHGLAIRRQAYKTKQKEACQYSEHEGFWILARLLKLDMNVHSLQPETKRARGHDYYVYKKPGKTGMSVLVKIISGIRGIPFISVEIQNARGITSTFLSKNTSMTWT